MQINYIDFTDLKLSNQIEGELTKQVETHIAMFPKFLNILVMTYCLNGFYIICKENNQLCGIASCFRSIRFLKGDVLMTVPGGFWAKDSEAEKALIEELFNLTKKFNLSKVVFKDLFFPLKTMKNPRVLHRAILKLPKDKETLLSLYKKNPHRDIKKAKENGLRIEEDNDICAFYHIWSKRMRDLGTPAKPFSLFSNFKNILQDNLHILFVNKDKKRIGGVILINTEKGVFDPFIASLTEAFELRPNPFLYHEMLSWAVERGYEWFDLGRSQPNSGNEKFKLKFGAKLSPLYSYGQDGSGYNNLPSRIMTNCWKIMPVSVTNYLGPRIRRYIPFG